MVIERREFGFTLVEVLVSLVLTSLLLAIILDGAVDARSQARRADQRRAAALIAQDALARAAIAPFGDAATAGTRGALRWRVVESVAMADRRGLYALVALRAEISNERGKTIAAYETRQLKTISRP